ncbi:hypothetical protein EON77_15990, partial [bacterium]
MLATFASAQSARVSVNAATGTTARPSVGIADSVLPELATSQRMAVAGVSEMITATVSLRPRDLAGLQSVADAVSDPASPRYRQYLTPEEVGDRFGADESDRLAVANYLVGQGIRVDGIAPNGMAITIRGTTTQMERAFATKISYFRGPAAD